MPIRDVFVTLLVFGTIPYILKKPYIGILVWSWLSYMNPHRLTWGFAYNMPFAQIVAIFLIGSMVFSKEPISFPMRGITIIWIFFVIWMGITTIFAYYPEQALDQYVKVVKIQLVAFFTIMLITNVERLNRLIWVIVVSIGFYGVKGGIFTVLHGGGARVYGPKGFIGDNNALAVAVLMIIPLMVYLYRVQNKVWVRRGLLFAIILSCFTVVGSQSRGAFLAIGIVFAFFWLKSQQKLVTLICVVIMGITLFSFMPESWYQRMETIKNYQEDTSAMGRINAWKYSINAANNNLFGVGFEAWTPETFARYAPTGSNARAAHSIYFGVLADHGWIGLSLFVLILFITWKRLSKVIIICKQQENSENIQLLARMLQVGLIAYVSGGAFLSLSYFDLPWHFVSFGVLLGEMIKKSKT